MSRTLVAALLALVLCAGIGSAQEAAVEVPTETAVEALAETAVESSTEASPWWLDPAEYAVNWLWKILASLFFAYLMKKAHDNAAMQDAISALEAGVQDAWVNFVRQLKRDLADEKWSDDEKANARSWAYNKAKELAKGSGKKLLIAWSRPYIDSLITKIVQRRKSEKSGG